jgi:Porin PorA
MRRAVGYVLLGLGVFLLVLAPLFRWYVTPKGAVAPLACTSGSLCDRGVSLSPSTGIATTLFDPGTLKTLTNIPVSNVRRVSPDVPASKGSHNRTVYDESLTTVRSSDQTIVDSSTARIAFNGHTSNMIDCCGSNTNGVPVKDFDGILPWKFPFGTGKHDYLYYDTVINKATPMKYVDTEKVDGLKTYKFVQNIPETQFTTLEVPGELVGSSQPSVVAPRFYSNIRTLWIEPVTGAIVKGREQVKQTLRDSAGADKLLLIDVDLKFTDANVKESVHLAKDGKSKLTLAGTTLPIVFFLVGLVLIVVSILLLMRRPDDDTPAPQHASATAAA